MYHDPQRSIIDKIIDWIGNHTNQILPSMFLSEDRCASTLRKMCRFKTFTDEHKKVLSNHITHDGIIKNLWVWDDIMLENTDKLPIILPLLTSSYIFNETPYKLIMDSQATRVATQENPDEMLLAIIEMISKSGFSAEKTIGFLETFLNDESYQLSLHSANRETQKKFIEFCLRTPETKKQRFDLSHQFIDLFQKHSNHLDADLAIPLHINSGLGEEKDYTKENISFSTYTPQNSISQLKPYIVIRLPKAQMHDGKRMRHYNSIAAYISSNKKSPIMIHEGAHQCTIDDTLKRWQKSAPEHYTKFVVPVLRGAFYKVAETYDKKDEEQNIKDRLLQIANSALKQPVHA